MNPRIRLAAFAAAALLSLPLGAADEATPDQLVARAIERIDAKSFDEADKAIEEALSRQPNFAPALVQKVRLQMVRSNEDPEVMKNLFGPLYRALDNDPRYGPTQILFAYIQMKVGGQVYDPTIWYLRGSHGRDADAPWLVPYHLAYSEKYAQDQVPKYRELFAKAGTGDPKQVFDAHHKLFESYFMRGEREKVHAEYVAMFRMQPGNAFIPGDYSRGLMMFFQDFDGGERYAREALAIQDYPHARQSLSLALYGKWAMAKRAGADPAEVKALLRKAQANDPGARNVPDCAVEYGPLTFVAAALDGLDASRRKDPTLHNC